MCTSKINLSITLILFIFLSSSNASSRSNFEKVSPAPTPASNNTPLHTNLKKYSSLGSENRSDRNGPSPSPNEVGRFTDDKYCVDALQRCHVGEDLFACIHQDDIVNYDKWVVLVQNTGETTLDVNIMVPTSVLIDYRTIKLAKHQSQKINISTTTAPKIVKTINLATYKGNCSLQINAKPSISDWIPVYSSKSTPIYAAYFMFFTIIIVGCVFTCCKFSNRKREARDGIPYQQIEMGNQMQSATGIIEESTGDGWDENWDDEWDDEKSTVGPAGSDNKFRTNGNGSSNDISSKVSDKKDVWDSDWDA